MEKIEYEQFYVEKHNDEKKEIKIMGTISFEMAINDTQFKWTAATFEEADIIHLMAAQKSLERIKGNYEAVMKHNEGKKYSISRTDVTRINGAVYEIRKTIEFLCKRMHMKHTDPEQFEEYFGEKKLTKEQEIEMEKVKKEVEMLKFQEQQANKVLKVIK